MGWKRHVHVGWHREEHSGASVVIVGFVVRESHGGG